MINQNSSSSWTHLCLNLTTTILFLLARRASSETDQHFLDCRDGPKSCDDGQTIKFPFYIKNLQKPFCGYPGFELSCSSKGQPVLALQGNDVYIVNQIFYENQTLRVSNAAFSDLNNTSCNAPIRNLTLPAERYQLGPHTINTTLLFNCNSSLPDNILKYKIGNCDSSSDENGLVLTLSGDDSKLIADASEECGSRVVAPVDDQGGDGEGVGGIARLKSGFVLKWTASNCSVCERSGGRCGFDEDSFHFQCFCPGRPHAKYCPPAPGNDKLPLVLKLVVGLAAGVGIVTVLAFLFWRKYFSKKKRENYDENIEAFLRVYASLCPKRYSYSDIKKITNSFKDKLGEGGFGGVYKGKLHDGRHAGVKVLKGSKGNGEDFINEVSSISRTSHINVVTLLGFCFEGHRRALVYEFMANGSLEKFIYEKNSVNAGRQLKWETLYQIAVGIARGLEYLHRGCSTRILHFDIKPHNILLDEDFCPKISDFGLAKICLRKESIISMLGARGTAGYIAPEVFSRNFGGVSHNSDVYSYGMMVLEMVGGRRNIDCEAARTSEIYFPHWIYMRLELDEELGLQGIVNKEDKERAKKMIVVSMWCIQTDPSNRPPMNRVVEMLEGSLESLQIPPKPFLSSPTRSPADSPTISIS